MTCGGAGCCNSGGMVAARARAARAAEARAGHRSGGAYTKGSLVPLVWSRSQIWSPTLILDVIGISQHLPERDRALSAHLCRRCTPGASAGFPGAPVLQSPPQRCQRHSNGGARAKSEGNRRRRSLQKARTNQRAAITLLGEASSGAQKFCGVRPGLSRLFQHGLVIGGSLPADVIPAFFATRRHA